MIDSKTAPYAVLLVRLTLAALFLSHAAAKIFMIGLPGFVRYFGSLGLPEWSAYGIVAVEVVGGIALIVGVLVRWVAILLTAELIGTIVMVHGAKGFLFTSTGGGWEYPAFAAATAIALILLGDGPYALIKSWPSASSS
jgi:putative oxidoreductase